jgi:hypothetical protein
MNNRVGLYCEPPEAELHLYERLEANGCWYLKDVNVTSMPVETQEDPKYVQAEKDGKAPMDKLPLMVLSGDAKVHALGAAKYGERNWRKDAIKQSTYEAAILRHFLAHFGDREDRDPQSGLSHLYHIRACCAVMLDAEIHGKLIDDRDR